MSKRMLISILVCAVFGQVMAYSESLMEALIAGNLETLKKKTEQLDTNFKDGAYVAQYLAKTDSYNDEIVAYLLAHGASIEALDSQGKGPLYYAISRFSSSVVKSVLDKKANPNAKWNSTYNEVFNVNSWVSYNSPSNKFTMTPLLAAWQKGDLETLRLVFQKGAVLSTLVADYSFTAMSSNKPTLVKKTVFDLANDEAQQALEANGKFSGDFIALFPCISEVWDQAGKLPQKSRPSLPKGLEGSFLTAIARSDMKSFKSNLSKIEFDTHVLLPLVAKRGNLPMLQLLLDLNSMDINTPYLEDKTLMDQALLDSDLAEAKFLLANGAKFPAQAEEVTEGFSFGGKAKLSLVNSVIQRKAWSLLPWVLQNGADANDGVPLARAMGTSWLRDLLVESGADVHATFDDGNGPQGLLVRAVLEGSVDDVKFYLGKKVDLNAPENAGALVNAVALGKPEAVRLVQTLLEGGFSPDLSPPRFRLPIEEARAQVEYASGDRLTDKKEIYRLLNASLMQLRRGALAPVISAADPRKESGVVTVSVGKTNLLVAKTKVTQLLYSEIQESNPSVQVSADYPVTNVNYAEAIAFCNKLSSLSGLDPVYQKVGNNFVPDRTKNGWRLPDRAEWNEIAKQAGLLPFVSGSPKYDQSAWTTETTKDDLVTRVRPVGLLAADDLGLYDLAGLAFEWGNEDKPGAGRAQDLGVGLGFSISAIAEKYADPIATKGINLGFRIVRNAP